MRCTLVKLRYEMVLKSIVIYEGMQFSEFYDLCCISFPFYENSQILGIFGNDDLVHYPISSLFVGNHSAQLKDQVYEIILKYRFTTFAVDFKDFVRNVVPRGQSANARLTRLELTYEREFLEIEIPAVKRNIDKLFDCFQDDKGTVNVVQLIIGLSVIMKGVQKDKVLAIFKICDQDKNDSLSLDEMSVYLKTVFQVTSLFNPTQSSRDAKELGKVTAKTCFRQADVNGDGKVSFREFEKWCQGEQRVTASFDNIRMLLKSYTTKELLDIFSSPNRALTKDEFNMCFQCITSQYAGEMDALFQVFDADGNGSVDMNELICGLSVFSGDSQTEKINTAFSLFDQNQDGYISREEMITYLTSVFKVTNTNTDLQPAELAAITVDEAFSNADRNQDGFLSYDEFCSWYDPSLRVKDALYFSLQDIQHYTTLVSRTPSQVIAIFTGSKKNALNFGEFNDCFRLVIGKLVTSMTKEEIEMSTIIIQRLFDVYKDSTETINPIQVASGLSILCGGTQEEKVASSFRLYDVDHDGYVSQDELCLYLASIFKLLYGMNPDLQRHTQVGPNELALLTAKRAFENIHSKGLSLAEFRKWYEDSGLVPEVHASQTLSSYNAAEVAKFFRSRSNNGLLTKNEFLDCFKQLGVSPIQGIFEAFDTDGNGHVDVMELSAGLSLFCGGTASSKINAVFSCFDVDQDGYLSKDEMEKYLISVFKVLATKQSIPDVRELARETMLQCFMDCDLNHDGKLSVDEFKMWYSKQNSTRDFRKDLGLHAFPAHLVWKYFEHNAKDNKLNLDTFLDQFQHLLGKSGPDVVEMLTQLFQQFDTDHNGSIDARELMSGLSVLTGGTQDEKVQAVFSAFDVNGDGLLSVSELNSYLANVFKMTYACGSGVGDLTPQELADITSQQIFADTNLNLASDGLDFETFKRWYSDSSEDILTKPMDLTEARYLTNLSAYNVSRLVLCLEAFATPMEKARSAKLLGLNRQGYNGAFQHILEGNMFSKTERKASKEMINRIYLSLHQDGWIPMSVLSAGLSILCHGTEENKVESIFNLFDTNEDDAISKNEMLLYLYAVYNVLFAVQPVLFVNLPPIKELCKATMLNIFATADVNQDGSLNRQEFHRWYINLRSPLFDSDDELVEDSNAPKPSENVALKADDVNNRVTLEDIKSRTNLDEFNPNDIFELFATVADADGFLAYEDFSDCFQLFGESDLSLISHRLFQLFDNKGHGKIDFSEVASGLSVLCGGTREDKVKAAFDLFDLDGNGFISLPEMTMYLKSVFRVLYELSTDAVENMSADELAQATAEQAFIEADSDGDGKISLLEFQNWYLQPHGGLEIADPNKLLEQSRENFSLLQVRRLTNLEKFSPSYVFETFAEEANEDGNLSKDSFLKCFNVLMREANVELSNDEEKQLEDILHRLFHIFDLDGNGLVDFSEISSGLSVLCGGDRDEKVQAAFELFDYNGDGYISIEEMTRYLVSVFRVLHETNPAKLQAMSVSPEELGAITAEQAYAEADKNNDGLLSLDEFTAWYNQTNALAMTSAVEEAVPDWWGLEEIRKLSKLDSMTAEEVFEALAEAADEHGTISRNGFNDCFQHFLLSNRESGSLPLDKDRLRIIVDRLFKLFDEDGNGKLDFSELASGLSVLCGGSRDSKVQSAFALYDYNNDGYISQEEMTRYLTSVFKVLFETSKDTQNRLGVSPAELGRLTAEQAFLEADSDKDGRLSFDEFHSWYIQPNVTGPVPGDEISSTFDHEMLKAYTCDELFDLLAAYADNDNQISSESLQLALPNCDSHSVQIVFNTFGTESVHFNELLGGMCLLCRGSRKENMRFTFKLFDEDNDGCLSHPELKQYLKCSFKIIQLTKDMPFQNLGVNASELALITADRCFQQAVLNSDMLITFQAFMDWYTPPDTSSNSDIGSARSLLRLEQFEVSDMLQIFSEYAPSGELTRTKFNEAFQVIADLTGGYPSTESAQEAKELVNQLFQAFDEHDSQLVDFGAVASGLSVLTGSSMEERALGAFEIFGLDRNGYMSLDEMVSYLTSVFTVMYQISSKYSKNGVAAKELGRITANQCFEDAELNDDNKLSFQAFEKWYSSSLA